MQTSYSLEPSVGYPGQINENAPRHIVSYVASAAIPAGCFVELDPTNQTVSVPTAATLGKIVGLACYLNYAPAGGYVAGDIVPVLRKGRAICNFSGGTETSSTAVNIKHGAGTPGTLGYATASSTSTTTDAEISAAPTSIVFVKSMSDSAMAYVELNLP